MSAATAPLTLRCAACCRLRHNLCAGREAGCRCWQCPGRYREIVDDARRRAADSGSAALLRVSLVEVLALLSQKKTRADLIGSSRPVPATCVVCARPIAASRFGRRRTTCSGVCRTRLWRQRQAERAQETSEPEPWPPAGFSMVMRGWESREAFERWWAAHGS